MHIKYLKSQRPLPEQALEANGSASETAKPMPRGKNGDRKPAALSSEATWKPVEKVRANVVAEPDALPTLLQSTERAERESEDNGKAKGKVWKVKEVPVEQNSKSDPKSGENPKSSDQVFPAKGGKVWKVKVVDTQCNGLETRPKEEELSSESSGNPAPDMENQPKEEDLSPSSSGSNAPSPLVDREPYDRSALLSILRRLRKEDALDDKCPPPPWRTLLVRDAAPLAPVLSLPRSKPESPVLRASAAEFVPASMLVAAHCAQDLAPVEFPILPEVKACALPESHSSFVAPLAVRAAPAAHPVPSGLTVRDLALRFQGLQPPRAPGLASASTAEVLECARPGAKTSKSNKISAQYLSTS